MIQEQNELCAFLLPPVEIAEQFPCVKNRAAKGKFPLRHGLNNYNCTIWGIVSRTFLIVELFLQLWHNISRYFIGGAT